MTCQRLVGRSSLAQQELLEKLGVPRIRSVLMTKYIAAKEIDKRFTKRKPLAEKPCVRCEREWFEWEPVGVVGKQTPYGPLCSWCLKDLSTPPTYSRLQSKSSLGEVTEPLRRGPQSPSPQNSQDPQLSRSEQGCRKYPAV